MLDSPIARPALGPTGTVAGSRSADPGALLARQLDSARGTPIDADRMAEIRRTAEDYEAVFLTQMLEHMFAGIEPNETFGGGQAETTYRSMLLNEYGKHMAAAGGVGLADHLTAELVRMQEALS